MGPEANRSGDDQPAELGKFRIQYSTLHLQGELYILSYCESKCGDGAGSIRCDCTAVSFRCEDIPGTDYCRDRSTYSPDKLFQRAVCGHQQQDRCGQEPG